ncbi:hypothetical protein, partial [Microbulbifer taiwanensis]|uniref:hypothetical protein n=1 Tax=Microbulbifer taiwanensis TaxID=986746 RepID=UPI0036095506
SAGDDEFTVAETGVGTGVYNVGADLITFSDVTTVNAGAEAGGPDGDKVNTVGDMTLTGADGEFLNNNITFSGIESVGGDGSSIVGSDKADHFIVKATTVNANGIEFSGFASEIDAGSQEAGTVDEVEGHTGQHWTIVGNADNSASNNGITFVNAEKLTAASGTNLLGRDGVSDGTDGHDNFVLTADGDVKVGDMTFFGVSAVEGRGGVNDVDASDYVAGLALTGADNEIKLTHDTLNRVFQDIDTVTVQTLTGSAGDDEFTVAETGVGTGVYTVGADLITFSDVTTVNAGAEGANGDKVNAVGDMTLTGADGEFLNNSITFSGIESVSGDGSSIVGSAKADHFIVKAT